jgi:hypothetical protein
MKKIMVIILFLCIFFTGCKEDPEDYSISEINITGIPARIPEFKNESVLKNIYKVYLNASDSQSENDPPVAKGVKQITADMIRVGETYTVTINLQNPNPSNIKNPNLDTGSWSGTAKYFSVVLSPQDVTGGVNTIWVKAGLTLDKEKKNCDWNSLMDLRILPGYSSKINALYKDIVCEDPTIKK